MRFVFEGHRRFAMGSALIALACLTVLTLSTQARAAESVYWDNYGADPDNVAFANVDGSGGGILNLGTQTINSPEGMAYDTVTNRLFVANEDGGADGGILAINLDGTGASQFTAPGAPIEEPEGIVIDPTTRMIYWENTDATPETISWAKLDGSSGGTLNTTGTTLNGICCRITLDPASGRVFWVNSGASPETIGFANANNTGGGGILSTAGSTVEPGGEGLAVDPSGNRLYFVGGGSSDEEFGFAGLNGTAGGNLGTGSAEVDSPWGIAFDPATSRLYWANEGHNGTGANVNAFGFATPSGTAGNITIATGQVDEPQDPIIIKSPSGAGVPTLTRNSKAPASLSCSIGAWGVDYPGSFVYQAPRTFAYQWTLNGVPIVGATAAAYTATKAGSYACMVTATNQIGSASQTSGAINVKAAKVKLSTKKKANTKPGKTVTFRVNAANKGDIQSKSAKVCVKLPKNAKSALKAPKCKSLGKLPAQAKKSAKLKFKVKPSASGTYKVTFQVKGSSGQSAKSKIIVG
jgi:hypothetical protein